MPSYAPYKPSPYKQGGLALITVLFIFALVSLLAVSMQKRQVMSMAQASATFNRSQAMLLAVSAEDVAKAFLKLDGTRDNQNNKPLDSAVELWNKPVTMPLSSAEVFMSIRDLQGLFNLNALRMDPSGTNAAAVDKARERFESLLSSLSLPASAIPSTIARETQDWFDINSAASNTYQNLTPPYRASGLDFSHPSELLLLESMDLESYHIIEPYVTALPYGTPLNVNTTHEHILQAWDPTLSLSKAKAVVAVARAGECGPTFRDTNVFASIDDFWQNKIIEDQVDPVKNAKGHTNWGREDFAVKSQYFSVMIMIKTGQDADASQLILESIIKRDMGPDGFIGVVYRDFSRKLEDITTRLKIINCSPT